MRRVIDQGKAIDWGATSNDYATYRPGPPEELYNRLQGFGIGLAGQRILDLGTGTGVIAGALARRGAKVAGIDIAPEQIIEAKKFSAAEQLQIDFRVSPAEEPPFDSNSFDVATANQCFLYFDQAQTIAALRRLLVPGGRLVLSHFNWLPKIDPIAAATEDLILRFNPLWDAADFDGSVLPVPEWVPKDIMLQDFFWFDVDVPFDRARWRGRIRASRGIGASLPSDQIKAFDKEHTILLDRIAPETFTIKHRVEAQIFRFP